MSLYFGLCIFQVLHKLSIDNFHVDGTGITASNVEHYQRLTTKRAAFSPLSRPKTECHGIPHSIHQRLFRRPAEIYEQWAIARPFSKVKYQFHTLKPSSLRLPLKLDVIIMNPLFLVQHASPHEPTLHVRYRSL